MPEAVAKVSEESLRREICSIGARLYQRGYSAGNEGNISIRLSDDRVLCTPTLVSKGSLRPDDLVVIDFDLNVIEGDKACTSEARLHLAVYQSNPEVRAVVHCHPPCATAFGVAREEIPMGILPEAEVFLGAVPRAPYETPGTWECANSVREHVRHANTVILENHGTVSWDTQSCERAFWYTEILESYCQTLLHAKQIGRVTRLPPQKVQELNDLRGAFGFGDDARRAAGKRGEDLIVNRSFGAGPKAPIRLDPDQLELLAEMVAEKLRGSSTRG